MEQPPNAVCFFKNIIWCDVPLLHFIDILFIVSLTIKEIFKK
jgi:hypothetical protein